MLSFRPASFQDITPIDCHMKSHHLLLSNGPYHSHQDTGDHHSPMHVKTWSLESMSEPLVFSDAQPSPFQSLTNASCQFNAGLQHSAIPTRLMTHKTNESVQFRSVPHNDVSFHQLSSFDIEFALLEQTLRKDKTSVEVSKIEDEKGVSDKSATPQVLEPEFYFGDILGDEAIPPQPLVNSCKFGNKIQISEDEHIEMSKTYVGYEHRLHLPNSGHDECPVGVISKAPQNHETDLSTAIASIVSHASSESISPRHAAQSSEKQETACSSQTTTQTGLKRRAPDSDTDRSAKFMRHVRHKGWPPQWNRVREQLDNLESNRTPNSESVTTELLYAEQSGIPQESRDHEESTRLYGEFDGTIDSPLSDSSTSGAGAGAGAGAGIRSHPDLYENLSTEIREKVDILRKKISGMPRRKLRESLAQGVSLEDIEPLMCLNRDELAGMLEIGVTTLKMFVHNTLGVPRWPARALKSQQVKVQKLVQKKMEAERRGDQEQAKRVQRDLCKMGQVHVQGKTVMEKRGKKGMMKMDEWN